jgi:hypothetical protein
MQLEKIFSNSSNYKFCLYSRKSWIRSLNKLIHIRCMCMYTCIHKHTCINSLKFKCHAYPGWNIGPHKALIHKVYNNKLRQRNIEDKECAHHDAHFQKELDSIRLAWLALLAYSSRRLEIPLVKAHLIKPSFLLKLKQQFNPRKGWANKLKNLCVTQLFCSQLYLYQP